EWPVRHGTACRCDAASEFRTQPDRAARCALRARHRRLRRRVSARGLTESIEWTSLFSRSFPHWMAPGETAFPADEPGLFYACRWSAVSRNLSCEIATR